MSEDKSIFGSLVSPAFTFTHGMYTELHHPFADETCLNLAATYIENSGSVGLQGRRVLHVGSGFGAELRSAMFQGASSVIGLDRSPEEVDFACSTANAIADPDGITKTLQADKTVSLLYEPSVIREAAGRCRNEINQLCRLLNIKTASEYNERLPVKQCDVLTEGLMDKLDGESRDVLIGNIALHWLIGASSSLRECLDKLAPAIRRGGVAVFSVPYHFVVQEEQQDDEKDRQLCVYDTRWYRVFRKNLLEDLPDQKIPKEVEFRKAPEHMLIQEREARLGSSEFNFIAASRRYFAPLSANMPDVLRGLGLYEAVLRTDKPGVQVVDKVHAAIDATSSRLGRDWVANQERPSTFVYFFVYRRK